MNEGHVRVESNFGRVTKGWKKGHKWSSWRWPNLDGRWPQFNLTVTVPWFWHFVTLDWHFDILNDHKMGNKHEKPCYLPRLITWFYVDKITCKHKKSDESWISILEHRILFSWRTYLNIHIDKTTWPLLWFVKGGGVDGFVLTDECISIVPYCIERGLPGIIGS